MRRESWARAKRLSNNQSEAWSFQARLDTPQVNGALMKNCPLALLAAAAAFGSCLSAQVPAPRVLKLAHQFPVTLGEEGDFRDRLARKFAAEVEKRSAGSLRVEVYAANKLVKPDEYVDALKAGTADFILTPVNNIFGKIPELAVTILPGIIKGYEHGMRWRSAPVGHDLVALFDRNGIAMLSWMWQAAGIVSLERPIVVPEDLRDLRIRGAGKGVDSMLSAMGAKVVSMASSEIPKAFREHRIDAAVTAATSLNAFKLNDFCRAVTTPRNRALFYFLTPILASKATLASLTPEHRRIVQEVAVGLERFGTESARADEEAVASSYLQGGAWVSDMDEEQWELWQKVARAAAWREFERTVPQGAQWVEKALAVPEFAPVRITKSDADAKR